MFSYVYALFNSQGNISFFLGSLITSLEWTLSFFLSQRCLGCKAKTSLRILPREGAHTWPSEGFICRQLACTAHGLWGSLAMLEADRHPCSSSACIAGDGVCYSHCAACMTSFDLIPNKHHPYVNHNKRENKSLAEALGFNFLTYILCMCACILCVCVRTCACFPYIDQY